MLYTLSYLDDYTLVSPGWISDTLEMAQSRDGEVVAVHTSSLVDNKGERTVNNELLVDTKRRY